MKLQKAKVRDKILKFPKSWQKKKIVNWLNTNMRSCPRCYRVDVTMDHFSKCRGPRDFHKRNYKWK
jgi:DNA relaxase NicK